MTYRLTARIAYNGAEITSGVFMDELPFKDGELGHVQLTQTLDDHVTLDVTSESGRIRSCTLGELRAWLATKETN